MNVLKLRTIDPDVSKYFLSMVQDIVNFRENNNIKRNDFMQLLIQLKNRGKEDDKHSYVEQNGDGNLNNKSGDNGISPIRVP
jgi:cytochrome P450 family 6